MGNRHGRQRRTLYCHRPRVREAQLMEEMLLRTYCACVAEFYESIWEHIFGRPVRVEALSIVN